VLDFSRRSGSIARNISPALAAKIPDAMIAPSALHARCDTLWSEDMQHGMTLDEGLRIVNPFRVAG
jgi:predicted nucleic acid-binding protein